MKMSRPLPPLRADAKNVRNLDFPDPPPPYEYYVINQSSLSASRCGGSVTERNMFILFDLNAFLSGKKILH